MTKHLSYTTLLLCITFLGASSMLFSQGFVMDTTMTMNQFEQTVLEEKQEVWVVDFWASWCGPCMAIIPEMKQIHQNLEGEKVRFVSISWDRDVRAWIGGIYRTRMPWTQILVPDIRSAPFIEEHFPHKAIPTMFLVTPEGKIKKVDEVNLEKKVRKELKKLEG